MNAGQTASFSVVATGTAPLTYQWHKNGVDIASATSSSYTTPATTMADNGALFTVTVTNSVTSVHQRQCHPDGQRDCAGHHRAAKQPERRQGQTASFSVTATGTAPLSYQWHKNGVDIASATSSSYTTPATTMADSGAIFTVTVSNSAGSPTSNNATLTVTAVAPAITGRTDEPDGCRRSDREL